jgi:hypothetical protein
MPNKTVYIRVEDVDKWELIPNKAEMIHNAIEYELARIKVEKETNDKDSPSRSQVDKA